MDTYLEKGVKQVIDEFPEVGKILDAYGIGCAPCSVGTCLLKDVVGIHALPPEDERVLMAKIAKAIDPSADVDLSPAKDSAPPRPQEITYSPPMKRLVDEHGYIKKVVQMIPHLARCLDIETESGAGLVRDVVDFIRSYADRFHHAKEEEILFSYFDPDSQILQTMHEEHEAGRGFVRGVLEGLERKDREAVAENLMAYHSLLKEHIKKEDEILYPWMDRNLSIGQVGELFSKFAETDARAGDAPKAYEQFAERLETSLNTEEK